MAWYQIRPIAGLSRTRNRGQTVGLQALGTATNTAPDGADVSGCLGSPTARESLRRRCICRLERFVMITRLRAIWADITTLTVDAIVNAANGSLIDAREGSA